MAYTCQTLPLRYGFFTDNTGKYAKCPNNAQTCNSATSVLICYDHYIKSKDGKTCEPNNNSCDGGFWYKQDKYAAIKCFNCPTGAKDCSHTPYVYTSCQDGYFYEKSLQLCAPCKYGCEQCTKYTTCDTCKQRVAIKEFNKDDHTITYCKFCSDLIANCKFCTDSLTCTYCKESYFIETATKCSKCPSHCLRCQSATKCLDNSCEKGYFNVDGSCILCGDGNCINCKSKDQCSKCQIGYYLDGTLCKPCEVSNCKDCSTSKKDKCDQCQTSYFLTADKTKCNPCTVKGCTNCDADIDGCQGCADRYYPSTSTACSQCPANCLQCDQNLKCVMCDPYYQVNQAGTCELVKNCPLYQYNAGSICKSCPKNCAICNSDSCIYCDSYHHCSTFSANLSTQMIVVLSIIFFIILY